MGPVRENDRVTDLHVWRVGPGRLAAIAVIVSHAPEPPDTYKRRMEAAIELAHVTVEVNPCPAYGEGVQVA